MSSRRIVMILVAAVLSLIVTGLTAAGFVASYSSYGWLAILGLALGVAALVIRKARTRVLLAAVALGLLLGVPLVHLVAASDGRAQVITLPSTTSTRWLTRLIDEQDESLIGARVLKFLWRLKGSDRDRLVSSMHDAYVEMRSEHGTTASPSFDTLLGRQSSSAFDTIVIEPRGPPKAGVIFLHGYAGSFTLQCWLIAKAAQAIDALTVCPATDFSGHWTGTQGEETVKATIDYLRSRGVRRLFLAGLSNGGVGVITLAPRFVDALSGLIVISGSTPTGGSAGLPTLVVQGEEDAQASAATAHAYAERVQATYAGFDGGHFVLLTHGAAREAVARWLREHR